LNAVVGRPPEDYGMEPTAFDQLRRGTYDVHERVRDMNVNGVLASMCFPSFPGLCGALFARQQDKNLAVMLQAYNDWHIDEWCGSHPGRFIPLALPPLWDAQLLADEVRRVAKKGCRAISFTERPEELGFPSIHNEHWDPFWTACSDEGMVICIHIGSGGGMKFTAMDAPVDVMIAVTPMFSVSCAADIMWSRVLKTFPKIKFALSEGGIGWIPYFLERADYVHEHHHAWTHQDFGGEKPSDLWRKHVITCFIDDPIGVKNRHAVGIDTITWECDYPHSDTTWPHSPERLARSLTGVPDDEVNKITHENALRFFQMDAFKHRPKEKCTAAALRAESPDVDTRPKKVEGGKPPTHGLGRPVTTKDITEQLASVYATQPEATD
jgi:predicted TIM-barrel fold metal-dependent hydrolase